MKCLLRFSPRRFSGVAALFGVVIGLPAATVSADTLTVAPSADTTIISSLASRSDAYFNYGGGSQLYTSQYGAYANPATAGEYGLMRFELPASLKDAEIVSVTLVLTTSLNFSVAGTWSPKLEVFQIDALNKDWVQGSANGALGLGASGGYMNNVTAAPPITGDKWASGALFNQAEGDTVGVIGMANLVATPVNSEVRVSLDIESVRRWLTDEDLAQAGIAVHLNTTYTGGSSWLAFHSSRAATEGVRPYLEIEYQAIPEPKALGLIVLPIFCALLKRKHELQRG